jgi:putative addiction module killer protein
MFRILEYETEQGDSPFNDWINNQIPAVRTRIAKRLDRVALGNLSDRKSVGEGVSELRIDYGPGYRVYYGRKGNELVILLGAGTKKNQAADIVSAKKHWKAYKKEK